MALFALIWKFSVFPAESFICRAGGIQLIFADGFAPKRAFSSIRRGMQEQTRTNAELHLRCRNKSLIKI
jgi:hypothetical protein